MRITSSEIDIASCNKLLVNSRAGALAGFEGWIRDHNDGHNVLQLEYEVYNPIAESEGNKIIEEAKSQFDILDACSIHRSGLLDIGDCAVWVGVSAVHRNEAFDACRYIIDNIKIRLPIWKKEYYKNGDSGWVNCERCASVK
jgi:molybdopterin synthase catalytic subunit|tara:strand:+ start:509 stop:934 length:426 start_codon:yes stop_codon:yes gene_type:complete